MTFDTAKGILHPPEPIVTLSIVHPSAANVLLHMALKQ